MRNSIDIIPNPHLKGLDCKFPVLPGLQSGTIIKLTQNSNSIFVLYQVSGDSQTSSMNKAQIPSKLCQLNSIIQGSMHMQPIANLQQCRKLTVYVNKLDYEIINNKVQGLQEQFMNQVTLVWPNAKIPLYYDKSNHVSFRVQCDGPSKLVQNSELEVLLQKDSSSTKAEVKTQQYKCNTIKILPISMQKTGNINKIYIDKAHQFLKINKKSTTIDSSSKNEKSSVSELTMPSSIKNNEKVVKDQRVDEKAQILTHRQAYDFRLKYKSNDINIVNKFPCDTNKLSIKQQISMIKRRQQNVKRGKRVQKLLVQLQLMEENDQNGDIKTYINPIQQDMEQMKEQQQNIIYINECLINNWNINLEEGLILQCIPKVDRSPVCKKLQYLLNQKDLNIHLYVSQKNQRTLQYVDNQFVDTLLSSLIDSNQNRKQIKIYGKMPYMIKQSQRESRFSYINIKRGDEIIGDPLTITYTSKVEKNKQQKQKQKQKQKQEEIQIQKIKQKLLKTVKITNYFYQDQNEPQIKLKTNILNQLGNLTIKKSNNNPQNLMVNSANDKRGEKSQELFLQLYKICYQQQINKLLKCLVNSSDICPEDRYILITSFSNNGKTIMNKIIRQRGYNTLYIDISQMDDTSLTLADLSEYLELVFQIYEGSFIFMDNLDSVCYKIDEGDQHRRQERIASKLLLRKIMKFSKQYRKTCIMTAKNEGNLDDQFHHYQLIKLKNPSRELREHVLQEYYKKSKENISNQNELNKIQQIVGNSQSMSFGQFSKYVITGHRQSTNFGDNKGVINFSKLAGVKQAKSSIRTVIEKPNKYGFVYKKLPIKLSRGILLYGGSGTGKSAIGEALAGEFKMKFFSVKGSDILSKYIGGSEAAVRDVFEKAMSVSPSIVFFDEFESIVPRRNSSNTGVTDRVVNQFLCYLDGVASVQGVYIVASSSRPQLIDPALLRPGRIDTHIFLDYPNREERQQLLALYSNSIQFETDESELLEMTEGYSYSDLIGLIKQLRIKQSAKILKNNTNLHDIKIDQKQFKFIGDSFLKETIKSYQTSTPKEEKDRERKKYLAFKRGDAPDMSKQKTILQ